MSTSTLLEGKRAVVFGGGGSIGAAVAEFALEGAEVFLAGRSSTSVEAVAKQIKAAGGRAHAHVVDALDEAAVGDYFDSVVQRAGGVDIEFNATGPRVSEYANGNPAANLPAEEFMVPVNTVLKTNFITASAAARQMLKQGSGVIIFVTGSPAKPHTPATSQASAPPRCDRKPHPVDGDRTRPGRRESGMPRTSANPDSRTIQDVTHGIAKMMNISQDEATAGLAEATLLKRSPRTTDTASAGRAPRLRSGRDRCAGTVINASAGVVPD